MSQPVDLNHVTHLLTRLEAKCSSKHARTEDGSRPVLAAVTRDFEGMVTALQNGLSCRSSILRVYYASKNFDPSPLSQRDSTLNIQYKGVVFIQSVAGACPNCGSTFKLKELTKWKFIDFTHQDQFTGRSEFCSDCGNSCIMLFVALKGDL